MSSTNESFDQNSLDLSLDKCMLHFPRLFEFIDNTTAFYRITRNGSISLNDIDSISMGPGGSHIRAAVLNNTLYIKTFYKGFHTRSLALLFSLNQAISHSPVQLPPSEFVIDTGDHGVPHTLGLWSLARMKSDKSTFLVPDFGFQAWPEVGVLSYTEVRREIEGMIGRGEAGKIEKLLWRGDVTPGPRQEAVELANETWADIQRLNWPCLATPDLPHCANVTDHKTIPQHCAYKYLLQTEGRTYSGRFKYLLNCPSVVIADRLSWDQHFHHLLDSDMNSPDQNVVVIGDVHFKDGLKRMMEGLQMYPEYSEKIRRNAWEVLRNRYLTRAAVMCYWRRLLTEYAGLLDYVPTLEVKGENDDETVYRLTENGKQMAMPYDLFVLGNYS
ncbi:hypothetical protein BCR33DRAFT_698971 [Rhizoclosmatium globosum]|uniref:Glycosyl transferase CAP10 domain-containing protein n=1 Tax=Rhizoclosmatium globosum TaxID=329046 RepID=A0A1Y2C4T7_9FUNG|nr:hypothetical protein BCR33DRAFT_698971 [Rhizoclosmatium globosum]|eukprot:ORY42031.1 hypothetical protein BCR33DRAFT_698971 [Rhizoclosmatium globosum]